MIKYQQYQTWKIDGDRRQDLDRLLREEGFRKSLFRGR